MADEQIVTLEAPFTGENWSDTPPVIEQETVENKTVETGKEVIAPTGTTVDDKKKLESQPS